MRTPTRPSPVAVLLVLAFGVAPALTLGGCGKGPRAPQLARIYDPIAQAAGDRHPVVVIPGVLGTRLVDASGERTVWGAYDRTTVDPEDAEGARLVAIPMREGVPLADLRDEVRPDGVLDSVRVDVLGLPVQLAAYVDILRTLDVGHYRDSQIDYGDVDWGDDHYTCFQFAYDWRRDVAEQAVALHEQILEIERIVREATGRADRVKVDVIAHSMGGLVLRYYLRYGPHPPEADGTLPPLTWQGAEHVERAILVGTPSAGSVEAVRQLVEGVDFSIFTPRYAPPVLGTMPALYQLLPRTRHRRVVDAATEDPIDDLYDADAWDRRGWGLLDPDEDRALRHLLPEVGDASARRRIARDHLAKCLARAETLHRALDVRATPPPGLEIRLVAADSEDTPSVLAVDGTTGRLRIAESAPGDGTVTRASAIMDERLDGGPFTARLRSPIAWREITFLFTDHLGLTRDPGFTDNVLHVLLEAPRPGDAPG